MQSRNVSVLRYPRREIKSAALICDRKLRSGYREVSLANQVEIPRISPCPVDALNCACEFMSSQTDPYECLKTEIDGYIGYSKWWAVGWAIIYYSLRGSLIIVSACVAAKGGLGLDGKLLAFLSLTVAIGTALDTWLKTGTRYKGHYVFCGHRS